MSHCTVDLRRRWRGRSEPQIAVPSVILREKRSLTWPQNDGSAIINPSEVVVELQKRAPRTAAVGCKVSANHRVFTGYPHQRKQSRPEIDLTRNGGNPLLLDVRAQNQTRNMKFLYRHQRVAIDPIIMVRYDQEQRVVPVSLLFGGPNELSQGIVSIFHRIVYRLLVRFVQCDFAIRELERLMVGGGKNQTEKWFALGVQMLKSFQRFIIQVFVRRRMSRRSTTF